METKQQQGNDEQTTSPSGTIDLSGESREMGPHRLELRHTPPGRPAGPGSDG